MRILLIEDDERVAAYVVKGLGEAGHVAEHVADGRDGLYHVAGEAYDVVILDRMLPGVDGLTILQTMRAAGNRTPVIILSALGEVDDRVRGLRAGSDDYLTKPFAMSELLARIDALGRRPAAAPSKSTLVVADLEIDLLSRTVVRGGKRIPLSTLEFRLLEYMARHAGHVLTRTMILEAVWDYNFDPQTNIVDQHVSHLRQKIDKGFDPPLIETVRGAGYSLRRP
ncbi:MAG: response regulator transcription factor [Sphingosinicella sp.]|nr:response regulator transcription factor [Sphingosinicella sp.]